MNPVQMMQNMALQQLQSNPTFMQAQKMVQGKTPEQIKETCENLCHQYGMTFDEAWNKFQSQFPGLR